MDKEFKEFEDETLDEDIDALALDE